MNEHLRSIAERLTEIVLRYAASWKQVLDLPPSGHQTFLEVVRLAGYHTEKLAHGWLKGERLDDQGPTGTHAINSTFPFKAVDARGQPDAAATQRMDSAVCFILSRHALPRDQLVELVRSALDRGRPLAPIPLTPYGELLAQYPREERGFGHEADPVRDESPLGTTCVGMHAYCDSFVDRSRTSAQHDVLSCRRCHLRVVFPSNIATYGQLRKYLASVGARLPE